MSQQINMRMIFMKTNLNPPSEDRRKGCFGFGVKCGHESSGSAHSSRVSGKVLKKFDDSSKLLLKVA